MTHSKLQALLPGIALLQTIMLGVVWLQLSELNSNRQTIIPAENPAQISRGMTSGSTRMFTHENDLTAMVRDVLRRELRNALNDMQSTGGQQVVERNDLAITQSEKPLTYEQQMASENAASQTREIVTQAVRLGVWTMEDSQKLYANLPDLTPEQRIQLLEQFHGAVNRQELELEDIPIL